MAFSILILTLNEEINLSACLDSVSWCNDVVVLDSYSSDSTIEIAKNRGARVVQRRFDSFAGQRSYGLDTIDFKYPWVFHLDADERLTRELAQECHEAIVRDEHSGYYVPSKLVLRGKWLRRCATYPTYQMRFAKIGEVRFTQVGHGQRELGAERGLGYLREPYIHHGFSKGLEDWFEKHNRYSTDEARVSQSARLDWAGLVSANGLRRRRALKRLSAHAPARPLVKFLYLYLYRRGFLDGREGLTYCTLQAIYEYMIAIKAQELHSGEQTTRPL